MENSYLGFDPEKFKGDNSFLTEELLAPAFASSDLIRMNMFCSHLIQSLNLNEPDIPIFFSGFEKQVGEYSSSYRTADRNLTLISKIPKHSEICFYILEDENGNIVCEEIMGAKHITEHFGYKVHDFLKDKEEGEVISKDDFLFAAPSYDEYGNFKYGKNLNTLFMSWGGSTFEDSIVISDEVPELCSCTMVTESEISVNTNDILDNLYGDKNNYKILPYPGEYIDCKETNPEKPSRVLAARRRINYQSVLFDFTSENSRKINFDTDDIFYAEGKVLDIEIFCNSDIENLKKSVVNEQILEILQNNLTYYKTIKSKLEGLIENGKTLIGDSGFYLKKARSMTSPETTFMENTSKFDNLMIVVKTAEEKPLSYSAKMACRYGNKGIVAQILPKSQMPYDEDGNVADIVVNLLGVGNRLNITQNFESEVNFIGREITKRIGDIEGIKEKDKLFSSFLKEVNPEYYQEYLDLNLSDKNKKALFKEVCKNKYINVKVNPFHDTINFFDIERLYDKFKVVPKQVFFSKEFLDKKEVISIETPLIISPIYWMRLKHESGNKFSARSAGLLNLAGIPSKNARQFREGREPFSKTAIRVGEMELTNLLLTKDVEELHRFISFYSSNEKDREELLLKLLGATKAGEERGNVLAIEKIPKSNKKSIPKLILDTYLRFLSLEITKGNDESE